MTSTVSSNLSALKAIAEALNRSLHLEQALNQSLGIVVRVLNLRAAWVFLRQDKGHYTLAAHEGLPPCMAPEEPVWEGGCQCNKLARLGRLGNAVNMVHCSRLDEVEGDRQGLIQHASVALETPRKHIGILNVAAAGEREFDQGELALIAAVGEQMGVAIERALLFEEVRSRRLREQEALLRLSNALLTTDDLASVVHQVVTVTAEIFSARGCVLLLKECIDKLRGQELQEPASAGLSGASFEPLYQASDQLEYLRHLKRPLHITLPAMDEAGHVTIGSFCPDEPLTDKECEPLLRDDRLWLFWMHHGCRSLLVAPIHSVGEDDAIGLLLIGRSCVHQSDSEVYLSGLLANQAALAIEQARLNQHRTARQILEKELDVAQNIQQSFLPRSRPEIPGYELGVFYQAARQVGGDFYDFISLHDEKWGFVIADVAGKGVPAALVMALSRSMMRANAREHDSALKAVFGMNRQLLCQSRKDRFLSLFYAVLDPETGQLNYVRAGHNPPLHQSSTTGSIIPLHGRGMALGLTSGLIAEEKQISLAVGDVVVFYTDGLTEAFNKTGKEFGEARLRQILQKYHHLSAERLVELIREALFSFTHDGDVPPSDDVTVLVLKRVEKARTKTRRTHHPEEHYSTVVGDVSLLQIQMPPLDTRARKIRIYRPPDYHLTDRHYPVVYMQDGQNLFDHATAYADEWQVDNALEQLFAEGKTQGVIVVGIDNGAERRLDEYAPWPFTFGDHGSKGKGTLYADFLVHTLKPFIDRNYRTLPEREHTAIIGSSMGGLISLYTGLRHQNVFSRIAALSPTLHPNVIGDALFDMIRSTPITSPLRLYLDMGEHEGETEVSQTNAVHKVLKSCGYTRENLRMEIVPGAHHGETHWRDRFAEIFLWLFQPPRRRKPARRQRRKGKK